jgi:hypothetical protein
MITLIVLRPLVVLAYIGCALTRFHSSLSLYSYLRCRTFPLGIIATNLYIQLTPPRDLDQVQLQLLLQL